MPTTVVGVGALKPEAVIRDAVTTTSPVLAALPALAVWAWAGAAARIATLLDAANKVALMPNAHDAGAIAVDLMYSSLIFFQ
jgi:hypothetical protein